MADWNQRVIDEFRAQQGRVGGPFAGLPMVLVHHVGRRSGTQRVTPLVYLPGEQAGADADSLFIFASKAGAPSNPDWYHNLVAAGRAAVEVGTDRYAVTVTELVGARRDEVYAAQERAVPTFGEYAARTDRQIPVLELRRS